GYVSGGNLIIPRIINEKYNEIVDEILYNDDLVKNLEGEERSDFFKDFINVLNSAFKDSFRTVLRNKYGPFTNLDEIIEKCISEDKLYNLKTSKYDDMEETRIINSVMTDVEIMKAS